MTAADRPPFPEPRPARDDIEPVAHETRDRIITGVVTAVPFLALGFVAWQSWASAHRWSDFAVFGILYLLTGFGVTVGFHRYFTHRAFATSRPVRIALAVLGSAAVEGPITAWVADHRKHHAFADKEGDPHSPHVGHGGGWRGALRGLFHAHMGWLFIHTDRAAKRRYAPDLLRDRDIVFVDRTCLLWAVLGFVLAFLLGWRLGGSLMAGATGLLWGGPIRVLFIHHVTYSVNSLCHFFGRRDFRTDDESRNLRWLALPSLGEAWHNNHHAFPTSAAHGLRRGQLDVSAALIRLLERLSLVWDVVRVGPARQAAKAVPDRT